MRSCCFALSTLVMATVGCIADGQQLRDHGDNYAAPPAAMMHRPGPMVDGPGPGVMAPLGAPQMGAMQASHAVPGPMGYPGPGAPPMPVLQTQVKFMQPVGMVVGWQVGPDFAENQIVSPGRYDFRQNAIYRLKLTNIPEREGLVLYPTLQVFPAHPNTISYLSHVSVPLELTREDLDQIENNNFVTKVIYLPDPKFQDFAIEGISTLVSTELQPGVDVVAEAEKRGTIMAILRCGNVDVEMPVRGGEMAPVAPVSHQLDGSNGEIVPPMPIAIMPSNGMGVPGPSIVAEYGAPGAPAAHPYPGMGPAGMWGQPITATPIGLPGPVHLPLGGPAGLQNHTVRNRSDHHLPKPVDQLTIDVRTEPGIGVPDPVRYIEYTERHPNIRPGELSHPTWGGAGAAGANGVPPYCPPGQVPPGQ